MANNEIAVEAISEKLSEVTSLAEELDQALHSGQQDCLVLTTSTSTSTTTLTEPTTTFRKIMDSNPPEHFEVSQIHNKGNCKVFNCVKITTEDLFLPLFIIFEKEIRSCKI